MNQTREKYILVKGSSGLGNRISSAATAILYSQISGRKLVVDWTEGTYAPHGTNAFHQLFDSPIVGNVEDLPETNSIYPPIWKGQLDRAFGAIRDQYELKDDIEGMTTDLSRIDYEEDIVVFCSYSAKIHQMRNLFTGEFAYLNKLDNREILKYVLSNFFTIQPQIKNDFDRFIEEKFSSASDNIGVHIRYSDMKVPVDKIYDTLNKVQKRNSRSPIFLSTDSQFIMESFKQKYDGVITAEKWYSPPGETLHQNWDKCPDPLQNGIEALQDIYLLSKCQVLIFSSQSSFGYLASLLASHKRLYDINQGSFVNKVIYKLKKVIS